VTQTRNDRDVLIAALTGPMILTGVGESERQALLDYWRRKPYPAEMERAKRLRAAIADLNRAGTLLLKLAAGPTDGEAIKEAEQAEAAAPTAPKVA